MVASRVFYVNGEVNFKGETKYIPESIWPKGHNLTIGGREFKYAGVHLNGKVTDVQIWDRVLKEKDALAFKAALRLETLGKFMQEHV